MAAQPEFSAFPDIYQWETVDPVQGGAGGIANLPLEQLTARTRYLLDAQHLLESLLLAKAPTDSPTLTGTPRAPTPGSDVSDTTLVTAAWVRRRSGGVNAFFISGDFQLNAAQAGFGVLQVGGNLTADAFLLFPPGQGQWTIANFTTGGFALKVRQGAGGGFTRISNGHIQQVWTDGFSFVPSFTDFDAIAITGASVSSLPDAADNSGRIATTGWVRRYGDNLVSNEANARAAGDSAVYQSAATHADNGDSNILNYVGQHYPNFDAFPVSLNDVGYQKLPTGLIIQWGSGRTSQTGQLEPVAYAIPFPHGMFSVTVTEDGVQGWGDPPGVTVFGTAFGNQAGFGLSAAQWTFSDPAWRYSPNIGYRWMAIGW